MGGQDRRGDGGAVATGAVHPDLTRGHLVDACEDLVDGDVHRVDDVGLCPFGRSSHVQHDDRAVVTHLRQVGERGPLEPAQRLVGPLFRRPGRRGGGAVDADPDQLALRLGDLSR